VGGGKGVIFSTITLLIAGPTLFCGY